MLQFAYNGLVTGSLYALLGVSFAFILGITGRLHVAYVATYASAPYVGIWLLQLGSPMWLSVFGGLLSSVILGCLIERYLYQPVSFAAMVRRSDPLIPIFVASLGITIAIENVFLLGFGSPAVAYNVVQSRPVHLGSIGATNVQLITIGLCWLLVLALAALLRFTKAGRRIRAVGQNPALAQAFGVRPHRVRVLVFAIASLMAGILGILAAVRGGATPTMGFDDVFNAFVVAFLAGAQRGPIAIGVVALLLGQVTGGLGGRLYSQELGPLVEFSIMLAYLCVRSMRGTRLALAARGLVRRLSVQRA